MANPAADGDDPVRPASDRQFGESASSEDPRRDSSFTEPASDEFDENDEQFRAVVQRLQRRWPQDAKTDHKFETIDRSELKVASYASGTKVGRFILEHKVGQGGFGIVFKAIDPQLERDVAIKLPRVDCDSGQTDRIHREARILATLEHPNIVRVYEAGIDGDTSFIVSQFCDGPDLRLWLLSNDNHPSPEQSAELIAELADAIEYAHRNGVLHRDIKPGNVLLFPNNGSTPATSKPARCRLPFIPKITDFGLASMQSDDWSRTRTSVVIGTPMYMAPECMGAGTQRPGAGCDIYSLGAILYELLTKRPPLEGEFFGQLLHRIGNDVPVPPHVVFPDVPIDLSLICSKCLSKEVDDRYRSAEELHDDLRRFLDGQPIHARLPSWRDRFVRWASRPQRLQFAGHYTIWMHLAVVAWLVVQFATAIALGLKLPDMAAHIRDIAMVSCLLHLPNAWFGWRVFRGSRWAFTPSMFTSVASLAILCYSACNSSVAFDYNYPTSLSKVAIFSILIIVSLIDSLNYVVALPAHFRSAKPDSPFRQADDPDAGLT
ncbi:serine/threonine protein kinase [Rosistilla oblonga]|uniref:serine/threonine protein kinase n=1 Tax=Rosistilla oblonga TaxID=2527990 RepID=UPI003A974E5F